MPHTLISTLHIWKRTLLRVGVDTLPYGTLDHFIEVLDICQGCQAFGTLAGIWSTADDTVQIVARSIAGEGGCLSLRREPAPAVALAGQRSALSEHAELIGTYVPQMGEAHGVHLRFRWHKLQLAFVLKVPSSKLTLHFVVDGLLF